MKRMSFKNKIILWFSIIIIVISFFVLYAMTTITQSIMIKEMEENLITSVNALEFRLKDAEYEHIMIPEHMLYNKEVQMVIYNKYGEAIFGYTPFGIETDIPFQHNYLQKLSMNGNNYYIYDKEIILNDVYIIRGIVCITNGTAVLQTVVKYNVLSIFIMVCIAILGGFIILNRAFIPINNIKNIAKEISESNDLTQRIEDYDGEEEFYYLTKSFNTMLDKVESSFNKEKQFTSDASHELRTPITVILSECEYGEECLKDIDNIDELNEVISVIKTQANKMSKLVSELLMISRMDNNRIKLNFEETNLSELLTFVCEEQVEIQSKNIVLKQNIKNDIYVNVDRLLITRLFINLISNAYQYSEENTTIIINLYTENDKVVFSVKDEGIGIAKEDIDKIWDRFYQVDSSRTDEENSSSGLGLSMVKWIVECHNGMINVSSELGKGSIFTFTLNSNNKTS